MNFFKKDNIFPADIDKTCLEGKWFNNTDPFNLAESNHMDATNPATDYAKIGDLLMRIPVFYPQKFQFYNLSHTQ